MEEQLSLSIFHDVIENQFGLFESYIEPVSNFVFDEWFYMGYVMSIIVAFIPSCKHTVVWCILLFNYLFLHHI